VILLETQNIIYEQDIR